MPQHEEFGDPVVVPGPKLRSRFADIEEVDDAVTRQLDDGLGDRAHKYAGAACCGRRIGRVILPDAT